jgi:hypothetical protein
VTNKLYNSHSKSPAELTQLFTESVSYNRPLVHLSEPAKMNALQDIDGLSECIGRAIQEHLAKSNINISWPQLNSLTHPVLRVEAFLEDAGPNTATRAQSERIASVRRKVS